VSRALTGALVLVSVDYRPAYPDATASPGPPRGPARKDDPYAERPATQVGQRPAMIICRPLRLLRLLRLLCVFTGARRAHARVRAGRSRAPSETLMEKPPGRRRRRKDADPFKGFSKVSVFHGAAIPVPGDAGVRRSVPAASSASSRSSSRATRRPGASRRLCARDRRLSGCPTRSASVSLALEDARQDAEDAAGGRASLFVVIYSGLSPASCVPGRARPR
jgi:hypothetical protein